MPSNEIWVLYQKKRDPELRQKLLAEYLPLVKSVAGRMAMGFPRSVELSDLVSTGVIGLVEAFQNFDPSRGVKFETYAVPRIRGAILDELRALDWVPRSTRAKSRMIEKGLVKLENRLGKVPSKRELARSLKITVSELHDALGDVSGSTVLSLDELIYKEDDDRQVPRVETVSSVRHEGVLGDIEYRELKEFMVAAIGGLSEQERLVVALYYYEELTLKEIGEVMQISESRVSQIHTKAIMKLRSMIKEKFPL